MPEFAEVNIHVKYLRERCIGWEVASYGCSSKVHFKDLRELPEAQKEKILKNFFEGNVIEDITQRGKQVVFHMKRGVMLTHLMFRGRWSVDDDPFTSNYKHHRELPTEKSNTLWLECTNGHRLNFHDSDYKGHASIFPDAAGPGEVEELKKLGPEIIVLPETEPAFQNNAWTFEGFQKQASRSGQAIKVFLLDQKKQSGLGNMYVCESLYRARIHPERPAKELSKQEMQRIFDEAQNILRLSIETNLDYDQVLLIYKRDADPDGNPVEQSQVGGRDTFYVPALQK